MRPSANSSTSSSSACSSPQTTCRSPCRRSKTTLRPMQRSMNGKTFSTAGFLEAIKAFHTTFIGKLTKTDDLAVSPFDAAARTGVVAQVTKFAVTSKADGSVKEQVSVTIVKVEEKDGKRILTSLVEAQA
ncbi:hypothetical protein B0H11DRAFT_939395 [Mycena galericulata]|nr:hypothetical protein B0H11DRAFT_939395 [Mycena galericulata]